MKEFFVGLLVLATLLILSIVGFLFLPVIVVLGFFIKWLICVAFVIFAIWLVGKAALMALEREKRN